MWTPMLTCMTSHLRLGGHKNYTIKFQIQDSDITTRFGIRPLTQISWLLAVIVQHLNSLNTVYMIDFIAIPILCFKQVNQSEILL